MSASLPPINELTTRTQLAQQYPHVLNEHRIAWALRHRDKNGLVAAGAVFDSPCGELLIHSPTFFAWFLGLKGREKPRALRSRRQAVALVSRAASPSTPAAITANPSP